MRIDADLRDYSAPGFGLFLFQGFRALMELGIVVEGTDQPIVPKSTSKRL